MRSDTDPTGAPITVDPGYGPCDPSPVLSIVFLVVQTAISPPACPEDQGNVDHALQRQIDADAAVEAGQRELAARYLDEITGAYPECPLYHARRLTAALRAADLRREEFETGRQVHVLAEAMASLDTYLASLRGAHGETATTSDAHARAMELRDELQRLLPPPLPTEPPPPEQAIEHEQPSVNAPQRPGRPHRGLKIGGGVAVGGGSALLAMTIVSAARAIQLEDAIENPSLGCTHIDFHAACLDLERRGEAAQRMFVAGLVTTPVVLGAGIAMLAIARRRAKNQPSVSVIPALQARYLGITLAARF